MTSISVPATDEPTLTEVVVEVIDTRLVDEVIAAEVVNSVFARRVTEVDAEIAPDMLTVVPVDTTETDPAVDVSGAVEFETAADPDSEMLPRARIAPVGATDVPPLMVTVPLVAVKVPAPECAPVKEMAIESLASTFLPTVTSPPVVAISTDPPVEVSVAPVAVVIWPEPLSTKLLTDCSAPVGSTVVPPVMLMFPLEESDPAPEKAALGVIVMFPEFVVV